MSDFMFTLAGCYEYDNTLFDLLELPEGIDKDILIDTILAECGEFEPMYANCDILKKYIGSWSKKHAKTFNKWLKAYNTEYEPLHNYDRHEEIHDHTVDATESSSGGSTENLKSAFDAATYQENEKDVSEASSESSNNIESTHTAHLYGNIGVTTSQQMLQAEYDIASWNIYNHIADIFADELLLCVY